MSISGQFRIKIMTFTPDLGIRQWRITGGSGLIANLMGGMRRSRKCQRTLQVAIPAAPAVAGRDIKGAAGQNSDPVKRNSRSLAESTPRSYAYSLKPAAEGNAMTITSRLLEAYLKCPTKCWLRSAGEQITDSTCT